MARRKEEPHEEHADESWLIPYSDLMTLLLALFIVLFASSTIEEEKFRAIMSALASSFGVSEGSSVIEMFPESNIIPMDPDVPLPQPPQEDSDEGDDKGDGGMFENQMDNLYSSLERYVSDNSLEGTIGLEFNGENVLITLKSDIWFQSGRADVTSNMVSQAHTLSALLKDNQDAAHPLEIIVTGHTDNVPIRTSRYPSNWYLSMERAFNFLAVLLENEGLNPGSFSARGYGEFQPIADNDTPEGRQLNRRVELMVSRPNMPPGSDSL
ncbi:MAG: OmpA family protein [Synergistaceae bacterium]|nr:OmpA family protein [Synergistaceae bacterium]